MNEITRKQKLDFKARLEEFRRGRVIVIAAEPPGKCQQCGTVDETRPYGPNNEEICFDCGMKDPETTERKAKEVLFGGQSHR